MPDTGADATLLDNGYDLIQCDDLDNNAQTAGPSDAPGSPDAAQPPGSPNISQHLCNGHYNRSPDLGKL